MRRIGIINRGEAAVRFLAALDTLRRDDPQAPEAVALYTRADEGAHFVTLAAAARLIGETRAAFSDAPTIIAALKETGCDAAWLGWGFAAEDAGFASALEAAGITILGPRPETMALLGDKIRAKQLAEQHDVPVAPWAIVEDQAAAVEAAAQIGFPLLLKAAAGGGGRGIRRVTQLDALAEAFESARDESLRTFNHGELFMERWVSDVRHVEVQVFGDGEGQIHLLGLRDCSLQRRRQKIIEECPAPTLPPAVEATLLAAARRLCAAVRYRSAGTVEFLYDPRTEAIYFLEVNTRLQVEHPVTEMVYGVDLVRAQIDLARGRPLGLETATPRGWAVEARVCAEDAQNNFAPAPGRLVRLIFPAGPGVRVDAGFSEGERVSSEFDSMIAKIIAWGPDRPTALARLGRALDQTRIVVEGGATNLAFLRRLVGQVDVRAGRVSTELVETLSFGDANGYEVARLAAALDRVLSGEGVEGEDGGVEVEADGRLVIYRVGPERFSVVSSQGAFTLRYRLDGPYQAWLTLSGVQHRVERAPGDTGYLVDGEPHRVAKEAPGTITAPSAAMVLAFPEPVGALVEAGACVVILESMKMEVRIRAPFSGVIRELRVLPGVGVRTGQPLLTLEPEGEATISRADRLPWEATPQPQGAAQRLFWSVIGWDAAPRQWAADMAALAGEDCTEALAAFADVADFFDRRPETREGRSEAIEPSVWLETVARRGLDALPPKRRAPLEALLRCHGVEGRGPAMQAALARVERAGQRLQRSAAAVVIALRESSHLTVEILDRLSNLDFDSLQEICQAAKNARFERFERPILAEFQRDSAIRAGALLARLRAGEARWADLIETPEPILGVFGPEAEAGCLIALEGVARRLESGDADVACARFEVAGRVALRVGVEEQARIVVVCRPDEVTTLTAALSKQPPFERLDLFIVPEDPSAAGTPGLLVPIAHALRLGLEDTYAELAPWSEICLLSVDAMGRPAARRYRSDGRERAARRDILPSTERRLDLDRLERFDFERLPSAPGIILFLAKARENPDDVRLLAYAEVRNLRRKAGPPLYLPEVDRVFYEAVFAMQAARMLHDPRRRLHWNRLTFHILPVVPLRAHAVHHYMRRLVPAASHIGMEKVIVRFRCADPDAPGGISQPMDLLIHDFSGGEAGYAMRSVSHRPLMPRTRYESKVVAARRRGLIYPYEIIRLLESGDIGPSGNFEEFDVDAEGLPVSVWERPRGLAKSAVIFGVMRSRVAKFVNGLVRVAVFSDPTQQMGALAEAECRSVIAALDLAERLGVPLEWVTVSAGARIDWKTGTENLDWTAQVLRRIIEFTQAGGEINLIVPGTCVGAQSYWNAEATMLMHTRGLLIMTEQGSMVLTGKRALDFSGCVSGEDERAIGGYTSIMGPNGQAQAYAPNLNAAYRLLFQYYDLTYVPPGARRPPYRETTDPRGRDLSLSPYPEALGHGFSHVGEIFSHNPDRKRPFAVRPIMAALTDQDVRPVERWAATHKAEIAVVWETRIGGYSALCIGVENQVMPRLGQPNAKGPDVFAGGTLYPRGSWKIARAINAASGRRPVVILANLSGFDGSPESLFDLQLEFGAEIGRAVVNFQGPILFVVTSRYHGGAYVVFSKALNPQLRSLALTGSFASVIGGAPAAAVVFLGEVKRRAQARGVPQAEVITALAADFDGVHTVARAKAVGSIDEILDPSALRRRIVELLEADYEGQGDG
ncbi:ATP-grasp domain-containing protein [Myxococcota bacterium]|nr:ATP-grasp domain-containing protein [Myxococcota bacterium]MBU1897113.1 ATP-grasp domain-containing protein [Myxococcota bacterium]